MITFLYNRLMHELDKKELSQKHSLINKLMISTVHQEILSLDKTIDALRKKLHLVEKTFKKNNTVESSKCWSEILTETKVFMDFLLESYTDLSKNNQLYQVTVIICYV